MHRGNDYATALFLAAALAMPIGAAAFPAQQDEHERHEQQKERRVYDDEHHEYRTWDKREDEAYRHWLEFKHQAYVDYDKIDRKLQREYWKWRHEHEDHDHDHQ